MAISDHFQVSDIAPLRARADGSDKKIWMQFSRNLDLGHVLTIVTLVGGIITGWNVFDKRLTVVEEQAKQTTVRLEESKALNSETVREVRGDVRQIKDSVNAMTNTLAITNYRLEQLPTSTAPARK